MKVTPLKSNLGPENNPSLKVLQLTFKVGKKRSWVPPGIYQAKITKIEQVNNFNKPVLNFIFEIVAGDCREVELRGFVNANYETFSENTKLYQWYLAASGEALLPEETIHMDDFYNKVLEVKVEDKISKKTKNQFSNVTEILRVVHEL